MSFFVCTLCGCSVIDILHDSLKPKTNALIEVAAVYSDYIIAYSIGDTMGRISSKEPLIIPHVQEGATKEEYGTVLYPLIVPTIQEIPRDYYDIAMYGETSNYVNVENIPEFDSYTLKMGDQLLISYEENGYNVNNNTIIASKVEIIPVEQVSDENYSLYTFMHDLGSTVEHIYMNNPKWDTPPDFLGSAQCPSLVYENGDSNSIITYVYSSSEEMEADANNMSADGTFKGVTTTAKFMDFKKGKLIVEVSEPSKELLKTLTELFGEPFAKGNS